MTELPVGVDVNRGLSPPGNMPHVPGALKLTPPIFLISSGPTDLPEYSSKNWDIEPQGEPKYEGFQQTKISLPISVPAKPALKTNSDLTPLERG